MAAAEKSTKDIIRRADIVDARQTFKDRKELGGQVSDLHALVANGHKFSAKAFRQNSRNAANSKRQPKK